MRDEKDGTRTTRYHKGRNHLLHVFGVVFVALMSFSGGVEDDKDGIVGVAFLSQPHRRIRHVDPERVGGLSTIGHPKGVGNGDATIHEGFEAVDPQGSWSVKLDVENRATRGNGEIEPCEVPCGNSSGHIEGKKSFPDFWWPIEISKAPSSDEGFNQPCFNRRGEKQVLGNGQGCGHGWGQPSRRCGHCGHCNTGVNVTTLVLTIMTQCETISPSGRIVENRPKRA